MTKSLFVDICYILHFVEASVTVADHSDRYCKIMPFLKMLNDNFLRLAPIVLDYVTDEV